MMKARNSILWWNAKKNQPMKPRRFVRDSSNKVLDLMKVHASSSPNEMLPAGIKPGETHTTEQTEASVNRFENEGGRVSS
jgi:hypothetical protein